MRFRNLGPLEVLDDGREVRLASGRQRSLLALLVLHANEVVSSDRLIEDLWGDRAPRSAPKVLQGYVSQLRRSLGSTAITTTGSGYVLHATDTDAGEFERLLAEAGGQEAREAAAALRTALGLWRGRPYADVEYEAWAQIEIARLDELHLTAVEARIDADLALGREAEVVVELEALVATHPLRERPRGLLMLALYRSGRQADALEVYRATQRLLADELGLTPSEELAQLERLILTHDPRLDRSTGARPTRTESSAASRLPRGPYKLSLPVPATPFVGREVDIAHVRRLLSDDDVRLVTLTGPGGSGKTRLALQAASATVAAYRGVWWVALASLRDARLVLEVAARAVGATSDLAEHIGDSRALLVLDNFEQVIAAAPDIAGLLRVCPRLTVLATSRERLRVDGEWEYAVDPLPEAEAVALFATRARAARRDFTAGADLPEICARLDNLPLAIELAAAQVKVLSQTALLERLERRIPVLATGPRDAPERQRTLRATIEWSYDLLTPDEQRLFARLAVFRGSCSLEAAEEVAGADLATLASLVDKSLLRQRDGRFSMLETVREYASELLERSSEYDALRQRHGMHFLALAEHAEPELSASDQADWHERLDRDHDNLRSALEWTRETGRSDLRLRLAAALWRFWYVRGYFHEAVGQLEGALAHHDGDAELRATALGGLSFCALRLGDLVRAETWADEALQLSEAELGDLAIAKALNAVANVAIECGDVARARKMTEQALGHAYKSGDQLTIARLTANTGNHLVRSGTTRDRGRMLLRDALERFITIGDRAGEALTLWSLGKAAVAAGEDAEGRRCMEQSLGICRELRFTHPLAGIFLWMAWESTSEGNLSRAVRLAGAAQHVVAETGKALAQPDCERLEATLAEGSRSLTEAELDALLEEGRRLTRDEAIALALGR